MDRLTTLRLRKIELALETTRAMFHIQAHRHVSVLAVALTLGGTAAFGAFTAQLTLAQGSAAIFLSGGLVLAQLRNLAAVSRALGHANAEALDAIEMLMVSGGEADVDAPATDP